MAFSSTQLSLVRRLRGNFSEWNYRSTADDPTVAAAAGYFNSVADRLRVGDIIVISGAGSPQVFAVSSNSGTVVGVTGIVTGGGGGGTVNDSNWSGTDLSIANGGTGSSDAPSARAALGLGTIATLNNINGGNWSGTDLALADGGTGASDAAGARTGLGLGALATKAAVNNTDWSGTPLAVANGGTGATNATDARANLGVAGGPGGPIDNDDWDPSGADLAVANGGTGASTETAARANLGLGALAVLGSVNDTNWSGADLTVTNGGTGASDPATARINLGIAAATETAQGIVELATAAEINTGTDNTLAISPDALAASYAGTQSASMTLTALSTQNLVVGDGINRMLITQSMDGMNLVSVLLLVGTVGASAATVQLRRRRAATGTDADMLSTRVTTDPGERSSATASSPAVINTANDDVGVGDIIYVDVDAVTGTPQGGIIGLEFRRP